MDKKLNFACRFSPQHLELLNNETYPIYDIPQVKEDGSAFTQAPINYSKQPQAPLPSFTNGETLLQEKKICLNAKNNQWQAESFKNDFEYDEITSQCPNYNLKKLQTSQATNQNGEILLEEKKNCQSATNEQWLAEFFDNELAYDEIPANNCTLKNDLKSVSN